MAWDDESKAEAVRMYEEAGPTPETSMEIVKEIAEEIDQSPNGVRMILTKAGVYVKKATATGSAKSEGAGGGRVSKAASQEALTAAIEEAGGTADEDVISKLTGKAAVYFTDIITAIQNK